MEPKTRGGCAGCSFTCSCGLAGPRELEVSLADEDTVWSLWQPLNVGQSSGPKDLREKPAILCRQILHFWGAPSCLPLGFAREWTLDHGPPSYPATSATHHELGVLWPIKQQSWVCVAHQMKVAPMWSGPTWVTWRSGTYNSGPQSCYTAFFLPACTCSLPLVNGQGKKDPGLVCGNMSQSEQPSTTAPAGDIS